MLSPATPVVVALTAGYNLTLVVVPLYVIEHLYHPFPTLVIFDSITLNWSPIVPFSKSK